MAVVTCASLWYFKKCSGHTSLWNVKILRWLLKPLDDGEKENEMEFLVPFVTVFIVLDIAALKWGIDSRDRLSSSEWVRRAYRGHVL